MDIVSSVGRDEKWLVRSLEGDINQCDIAEKHRKMTAGPFQFLRGTYWHWAETVYGADV